MPSRPALRSRPVTELYAEIVFDPVLEALGFRLLAELDLEGSRAAFGRLVDQLEPLRDGDGGRTAVLLLEDVLQRVNRQVTLAGDEAGELERAMGLLVRSALAQPPCFVHRDYMPRNLMVCDPNPGVLDFQDAVYGPISYDVVCLFKDAFISWDEDRVLDWAIRYWEKAKRARLPVDADFGAFFRDLEWMGLQRHLKVAGIFARLAHRDGKHAYLEDTPRFIGYIRAVCRRYDALKPLLVVLDDLEGRRPQAGYTF